MLTAKTSAGTRGSSGMRRTTSFTTMRRFIGRGEAEASHLFGGETSNGFLIKWCGK